MKHSHLFLLIVLMLSAGYNLHQADRMLDIELELGAYAAKHDTLNNNGDVAHPDDDPAIHFIWNDDEESIPMDGQLIQIEFTKNDTVYLTPVDTNE